MGRVLLHWSFLGVFIVRKSIVIRISYKLNLRRVSGCLVGRSCFGFIACRLSKSHDKGKDAGAIFGHLQVTFVRKPVGQKQTE